MLDPAAVAKNNRPMKTLKTGLLGAALAAALIVAPTFAAEESPAETKSTGKSADPMNDPAMMAQMMELAKTNENHKLLGEMAGTWNYQVKMWMAPDAPPMTSKGTAVRKPLMDGRYYVMNVKGTMQMPGPDGKMKDFQFLGMSLEGYDNVQKKFVNTWIDNMGTGIMMSEGTYEPSTSTFTYTGKTEMMPGMTTEVKETIKVADKDHHVLEWYEMRDGKEVKTMEIDYTRQK